MRKIIINKKLDKKFISLFLSVIMLSVILFTGFNVLATETDPNGNWAAKNVILKETSEAQLMVRVGDIDNFGFGWQSRFNPFSGNETPTHGFPFYPKDGDPQGTDRIMVSSGYAYNGGYNNVGVNSDGYAQATTRSGKNNNVVTPAILLKEPNKILVSFGLEYNPKGRSEAEEMEPGMAAITERLGLIFESGKPIIVSQAADPTLDRKITVEVTATILK